MAEATRVDAVVLGAGTAGSNAAYQLAHRGLSVLILERRAATRGGASWHNGVLDWQFERAGIPAPRPPERVAEGAATHLFGPDGSHATTVSVSPTVEADMALLGTRLRSMAAEAGAVIIDHVHDIAVELEGDRVVALGMLVGADPAQAQRRRIEARLFVDASGRRGMLRRASPPLARWCPDLRGDELCAAADVTFRIVDPDGAKGFLNRHGAEPTNPVNLLGRYGGWSTQSITVDAGVERVSVLVGSVASGAFGTPARMLADVRGHEPWIGERLEGATGLIPLRRPYARLTAPGVALVGDAASQVFPAHGSGIGVGLIAGRMLAEAVAAATDPGDPATLWAYQAAFHRELGGVLAGFDGLRRMSTALGSAGVGAMLRAGLIDELTARSGLDQRWATPPLRDLPRTAWRLLGVPRVAATMLPMVARAQVAHSLGARYPAEPDEPALARWDRLMARVLGTGVAREPIAAMQRLSSA